MLTRAPGKNYSVVNIMADFDPPGESHVLVARPPQLPNLTIARATVGYPVYKFELSPDKMYIHLLRIINK